MIRPGETSHADAALKWFLACVNSNVSGEFIGPTEATITTFHGASIWPFMNWRFARAVRVATWFYWNETERTGLLRKFRQDLWEKRNRQMQRLNHLLVDPCKRSKPIRSYDGIKPGVKADQ